MAIAKVMEGNFNWNFELTSLDKNHLPWVFPMTESVQPTINKRKRNANITLAYEAKWVTEQILLKASKFIEDQYTPG